MANLVWSGGGLGNNASEGANWTGGLGAPPQAGDNVDFNGGTLKQCNWDIAARVNIFTMNPLSDDQVILQNDLNCVSSNIDGSSGGQLDTNGFFIDYENQFSQQNGGMNWVGGGVRCSGNVPTSTFQATDALDDADLVWFKSSGSISVIGTLSGMGELIHDCTNGSFQVDYPNGSLNDCTFWKCQGVDGNLTPRS